MESLEIVSADISEGIYIVEILWEYPLFWVFREARKIVPAAD